MIDAYVINLDRQIENYSKVESDMNDLGGFNVQRVSAIDGKRGDHIPYVESDITWFCKETCPNSAIAIALSHKKVAKNILDSGVDYALVLEDDVLPIQKGFHDALQKTLDEVTNDWDIIKLYCQGLCDKGSNNLGYTTGSTAAMLVSRNGAKKIYNMKIYYHIDYQLNFEKDFKQYKSRFNLFTVDETSSTNRTAASMSSKLKTNIVKLVHPDPFFDFVLNFNVFKLFGFDWNVDDSINLKIIFILFFIVWIFKL